MLDEVSKRPGVLGQIPGRETLIRAVEEGEVGFLLQHRGDFFPLVLGEVDACGVVGAGVEEDYTTVWSVGDGFLHAVEVEAFGLFREVWVCGDGDVHVGEDLVVVGPCWVAEVDGGFAWVEA